MDGPALPDAYTLYVQNLTETDLQASVVLRRTTDETRLVDDLFRLPSMWGITFEDVAEADSDFIVETAAEDESVVKEWTTFGCTGALAVQFHPSELRAERDDCDATGVENDVFYYLTPDEARIG